METRNNVQYMMFIYGISLIMKKFYPNKRPCSCCSSLQNVLRTKLVGVMEWVLISAMTQKIPAVKLVRSILSTQTSVRKMC